MGEALIILRRILNVLFIPLFIWIVRVERKLVRIESTKRHIEELKWTQEPNAVELLEEARRVDPPPGGFPS